MKNILVKLGGSVITEPDYRESIIDQLVKLQKMGYSISIVHGGGKLISYYLNKLEVESRFVDGLRVTTPEALEVVMMALIGKVNKDIVRSFNLKDAPAIGLCGGDGRLIESEKLLRSDGVDLGCVGKPSKINHVLYKIFIEAGYIPVIATIGFGKTGYHNINADHTAAFIAQEVKADKLVYVSDVQGVLNPENNETFEALTPQKVEDLKNQGIITSGMLPKLYACTEALKNGVGEVAIINGKVNNSILQYAIGQGAAGTIITL
jgi:acetylglutamate kinase